MKIFPGASAAYSGLHDQVRRLSAAVIIGPDGGWKPPLRCFGIATGPQSHKKAGNLEKMKRTRFGSTSRIGLASMEQGSCAIRSTRFGFRCDGRPAAEGSTHSPACCACIPARSVRLPVGPGQTCATSRIRLFRSDDGAASWRELPVHLPTEWQGVPGSQSSADLVEAEPGELCCSRPGSTAATPAAALRSRHEGILHSKQLWCVSTDEGASWAPGSSSRRPTDAPPPASARCAGRTGHRPLLREFQGIRRSAPRPARSLDVGVARRRRSFGPPIQTAQHPEHKLFFWTSACVPARRPANSTALLDPRRGEQKGLARALSPRHHHDKPRACRRRPPSAGRSAPRSCWKMAGCSASWSTANGRRR